MNIPGQRPRPTALWSPRGAGPRPPATQLALGKSPQSTRNVLRGKPGSPEMHFFRTETSDCCSPFVKQKSLFYAETYQEFPEKRSMKTPWPAKTPFTCASGLRRSALSPGPPGSGRSHRPASPAPAIPCEEWCQHHGLGGGDPQAPGDGLTCPHRGGAGATAGYSPGSKQTPHLVLWPQQQADLTTTGLQEPLSPGGIFNHCPQGVHRTLPGPRRSVIRTHGCDGDRGH